MTIRTESDLREVAFAICTALDEIGVIAVLTGGSAATIYAPHAYQSSDLDFVIELHADAAPSDEALVSLGYTRRANYYVHDRNPLTLDFPPPPLMIGEDLIRKWDTIREENNRLHILTPTDSCRDRLAHYLFWKDLGCLEQALAVAKAQEKRIDLESIRSWCGRERKEELFRDFERRLREMS